MVRRQIMWGLLAVLISLPKMANALPKSGDILVADTQFGVWLIDGATHTWGALVGIKTNGGTQLVSPVGVSVGPSNEIHVLDQGDGPNGPDMPTVWKVDPATKLATAVSSAGLLQRPTALAIGMDGSIYVADRGATSAGGMVIQIGLGGSQTSFFVGGQPTGIAIDGSGNIEVSRTGEHQIDTFSPAGALLQSTATPGFDASSMAATSGDLVYLFGPSSGGSTDGYKFSITGHTLTHFFGSSPVMVAGAAVEPNGDIAYVETGGIYPTLKSIHPDGSFSWIVDRYYLRPFHNPLGVAVYGVRNGVVPARSASWGSLKALYRQ
jgi:sugar lactone lactonase YvrE